MHAIKDINNPRVPFSVGCFSFLAGNEDHRYDACKTGKVHGELQKDSLCFGSLSVSAQFLCTFAKQEFCSRSHCALPLPPFI